MDKNITSDIIRKSDIVDLRRKLRLDFIFQVIRDSCQLSAKIVTFIAFLSNVDLLNKCLTYIDALPDILIHSF